MSIDYFINIYGKDWKGRYNTLVNGTCWNTFKNISDDDLNCYDEIPEELTKLNNDTSKYTSDLFLNSVPYDMVDQLIEQGKLVSKMVDNKEKFFIVKDAPDIKNTVKIVEEINYGDCNVLIELDHSYSNGRWIDIGKLINLRDKTKLKLDASKIKVYEYEKQLNSLDYLRLSSDEKETVNSEISCIKDDIEYLEDLYDSYNELFSLYRVFISDYRSVYIYIYSDYEDTLYESNKDIIDLFG